MKSVKKLIFGVTALPLLACGSAPVHKGDSITAATEFTVETHTAGDPGFDANSFLLKGKRDAILIDAQFTRSEAKKVAELIKASGKNLKTVFITHGHPDHYLGLEILTAEFPKAKVVATPEVIADIKNTAKGKLSYWKPMYKDDLADGFVTPEPVTDESITIEGNALQVIKLGPGESESSAALFMPGTGMLFTGDNVYNEVHLWLAENRPQEWLTNLKTLEAVKEVTTVYPGHGPVSSTKLFGTNATYINDFVKATTGNKKKAQAVASMKKKYSGFKLPIIAELSVGSRLKK